VPPALIWAQPRMSCREADLDDVLIVRPGIASSTRSTLARGVPVERRKLRVTQP
jgi:hypothetical protein